MKQMKKKPSYKFPLSISQQHDLAERIVKSKDSELYVWYALIMNTARRAQQIASLKWSDIHEDIIIKMPDKSEYFAIDFLDSKSGCIQRVWASVGLLEYLKDWRNYTGNKKYVFHPVQNLNIHHDIPIFCLKMSHKLEVYLKKVISSKKQQKKLPVFAPNMLLRRTAVVNTIFRIQRSDYTAFLLGLPQELCEP